MSLAPEQFGITEMVLKNAAEPEAVERIAALGLDGTVALLTGIHEVYGERMGFTDLLPEDGDAPLFKWPFLPRWHAGAMYGTFTIWCHRFLNG